MEYRILSLTGILMDAQWSTPPFYLCHSERSVAEGRIARIILFHHRHPGYFQPHRMGNMSTNQKYIGKQSSMEMNFIEQYLSTQGYCINEIGSLSIPLARQLMAEASRYASLKLAELESKAGFREKIKLS